MKNITFIELTDLEDAKEYAEELKEQTKKTVFIFKIGNLFKCSFFNNPDDEETLVCII